MSCARWMSAVAGVVLAATMSIHAQDRFYDAYEQGIKAYNGGDLATARQRFGRALQLDPKQARNKLFHGMVFRDYLPEYYLALISAAEKQYEQAREHLKRLQGAGLIKQGDREYTTLTAALSSAPVAPPTAKQKDAASPAGTGPSQPAGNLPPAAPPSGKVPETTGGSGGAGAATASGNTTGGSKPGDATSTAERGGGSAPPGPAKPPETPPAKPPETPPAKPDSATAAAAANALARQRFSDEVDTRLKAGEFQRAWSAMRQAEALPGDAAWARSLATRIRVYMAKAGEARLRENDLSGATRIAALLESNAAASLEARQLRGSIDARGEVLQSERDVFRNLLLGDYRKVVDGTTPIIADGRASGRILYYAACAKAALALTGPTATRDGLAGEARQLYSKASSLGVAFTKDEPYISPGILALLRKP